MSAIGLPTELATTVGGSGTVTAKLRLVTAQLDAVIAALGGAPPSIAPDITRVDLLDALSGQLQLSLGTLHTDLQQAHTDLQQIDTDLLSFQTAMLSGNAGLVVLASATDTASGRTSPDFVNSRWRGMLLLLDVTSVSGAGAIASLAVQVKTAGGHYATIQTFSTLGIATSGVRTFYLYPGAAGSGGYTGNANLPLGYTMRAVVTGASNNSGDTITYTLEVVWLK